MANIFNEEIEGVKLLVSHLGDLKKELKLIITQSKEVGKSLKFENLDEIKKVDDEIRKITKAEKELIEVETLRIKKEQELLKLNTAQEKEIERLIKLEGKAIKEKKKGAKISDEEYKDKLKLKKVDQQRRKDLEAEIILEQKSIKTRNELRETIKALRIEANKLELGSEELKKANDEIDELDAKLKSASDQFVQNKINIGNYKDATVGLTNSFEDQKKKLKILEDTYKDSVSQGKKNTKEAKELRKELKKQKKDVDNVSDSMKDLEDSSKNASKGFDLIGTSLKAMGIGAILAIFSKLGDLFGSSRVASLESQKAMANFTETVDVFFKSLIESVGGVKVIFNALIEVFRENVLYWKKDWLNLMITIAEMKDLVSDNSVELAKLGEELAVINGEQKELEESANTLGNGWDMVTKAFEGFNKTTKKAILLEQKYIEMQLKTKIQIEAQTRALAGLQEKRQILQDISDDDTLGFETRALAVKKAQKVAVEFADKEVALAKLKERLTIEAIKGELFKAKVQTETQLKSITTGEQLNRLLKDKKIAMNIADESETAFTEAFVERVDKQTEALSFNRDQEEKNRKTFRDSYEQRLDIIEEFGEMQFAKNEELSANDKESQAKRNEAFAKNQKLSNDLFLQGAELTLEQGKKSIDLNKSMSQSEKDVAKAKLNNIDLNAILNAQSEEARFEMLRSLNLGEIEEKRLKETFKIRFEQNKALIGQEADLKDSNRDSTELKRDIALQEIALSETTLRKIDELENDRFEGDKQNLEERIELLNKDSIERLNLERELNELLLTEQEQKLAKEKEATDKNKENEIKAKKELYKKADILLDKLAERQRERHEERLKQFDEEVKASEDRESKLKALADKGNLDAEKNITFEKRRQAELEKEKIAEEQRQKRRELGITALKTYSAKAQGDHPETALTDTLKDMALLMAGIEALSYFDGTEDTGTSANPLDSNGGRMAMLHDNERVVPKLDNNKMRGFTNGELGDLAQSYKRGELIQADKQMISLNSNWSSNNEVLRKFEELNDTLKSLPANMPQQDFRYNEVERAVTDITKTRNRVVRNHTKVGGIWGK